MRLHRWSGRGCNEEAFHFPLKSFHFVPRRFGVSQNPKQGLGCCGKLIMESPGCGLTTTMGLMGLIRQMADSLAKRCTWCFLIWTTIFAGCMMFIFIFIRFAMRLAA